MSIQFSANLSSLRREKGVSQKQAAEALGVSQALLSHYEKGIRECNLDFVKKVADYYDVTADYLLGLTESRQTMNEIFRRDELADDSRMIPKTVIRSILFLAEQAQQAGESEEIFFTDFFTLCVKQYLCAAAGNDSALSGLCGVSLDKLCRKAPKTLAGMEEPPLCARTADDHAMLLLNNDITEALK